MVVGTGLRSRRGNQSYGAWDERQGSRQADTMHRCGAASALAAIRRFVPRRAGRMAADKSEQACFARHTRAKRSPSSPVQVSPIPAKLASFRLPRNYTVALAHVQTV